MKLLIGIILGFQVVNSVDSYQWSTHYFQQKLDHFDYHNGSTFTQRFLVADQYWKKPDGPIFVYTGNEGTIDVFANNTGFMWEIAPEFGALLVFIEHRYFGESIPGGPSVFKHPKSGGLQWLTSEQALADYAVLLTDFKEKLEAKANPVIAFGGSYGGMLASWFRVKYPDVVAGAIAASAPVLSFTGAVDPRAYMSVNTRTFHDASPVCSRQIAQSWGIMSSLAQSPSGRTHLQHLFRPCQQLQSPEDVTGLLFNYIAGALQYMAMADYPYPADFLGPMPGYPVNYSCNFFNEGAGNDQILTSLRDTINVYYNFSGQSRQCFDLNILGPSTLKDLGGWNYLACTEMIMPIGQYGPPSDMFFPAPWNLTSYVEYCKDQYAVDPRPDWILTNYGSKFRWSSNIVFSNGNLDPWSSGGVTRNITGNSATIAVLIEGGAHHLDLRHSQPQDPSSVTIARNIHRDHIRRWIHDSS